MKELERAQYDNQNLWDDLKISESNKERILEISKMIPQDVNSLADLGCGNGLFLNSLKTENRIKDLIGVDFSTVAIEDVKTKKKVGDITDIPLESKSYDMVCALEVLEHLSMEDFKKAREELSRVSEKYILISVPFNEDLELEFFKCPNCKTRFNTSHHKRTFNEKSMRDLFNEYGFTCEDIKYISRRNHYYILTNMLSMYRKLKGAKKSSGIACPVCGYRSTNRTDSDTVNKRKHIPLSSLKKIMPKRYTYKWIAAIYKINKK